MNPATDAMTDPYDCVLGVPVLSYRWTKYLRTKEQQITADFFCVSFLLSFNYVPQNVEKLNKDPIIEQ